ncbi:MAG: homoserine dehydrogenase [Nitrospirota bacterium]|jgi:homoserine dehydrogenase
MAGSSNKQIGIGILGLGTIGTGTATVLLKNRELLAERLGVELRVVAAADLDPHRDRGIDLSRVALGTDPAAVIHHPQVDIVVELIGGTTLALDLVREALTAGKPVVTANKALLARHGEELFALAMDHAVALRFEAAVGGGIPIIKALTEGLVANRVEAVYGIVNGTCNYILTEMDSTGADFDAVLKEAMALGYAEADPTIDIEGIDAAHKAAILARLAFDTPIDFASIPVEGIAKLGAIDTQFARQLGYVVKLLAVVKRAGESVDVRVHPTMLPADALLAKVVGVFNAVVVRGDAVGETLYYGPGAGALPTASAVVADIAEIAERLSDGGAHRAHPCSHRTLAPRPLLPIAEVETPFYIRFDSEDRPGVLSKISGALGNHGISIDQVRQHGRHHGGTVPLVILTHDAVEGNLRRALVEIEELGVTAGPAVVIRVED